MATRKENLKSLFTNTRTRVIILLTAALIGIAIVYGFFKMRGSTQDNAKASINAPTGGIRSIPGALNPTKQYAELQAKQNLQQAKEAKQKGTSSIPTIIRTQKLGEGAEVVGAEGGQGSVGFSTLKEQDTAGKQKTEWINDLKLANCSKSSIDKVLSEGGNLSIVKQACGCAQLKDNGYNIQNLQTVCSCKELKAAGFNARQFKRAGYSAGKLRQCGFNACEERNAGYSAQQMKAGGFSDGELKGAGFPDKDISQASGLPDGVTAAMVHKAGCSQEGLEKLHDAGVSALAIRNLNGCSASALKAAGYSAKDLADAGFTAAELKRAGFGAKDLKDAGFSARDLLNAGFSPKDLEAAGFTPAELKAAESELPPGLSPQDIKNAGCDVELIKQERLAGASAKMIHQEAGCSAKALKAAGFTDDDLANAGFTADELKKSTPPTDAEVRLAKCDQDKLRKLREEGVTAKRIMELNKCDAKQLKAAGYGMNALKAAGLSDQDLLAAGFTPNQLKRSDMLAPNVLAEGRDADCSVDYLKKARAAGVSARTIRQNLGCSASALKAAGYTAKDLKDAGFTAAELKNAGFSAKDLKDAGFTAAELKDAGFSAKDLKDAGFTAAELKDAGFTAKDLKAAGFSAGDLKKAGFSRNDLQKAGYTDSDLSNAGYEEPKSSLTGVSEQSSTVSQSTLPGIQSFGGKKASQKVDAEQQHLQQILQKQTQMQDDQKFRQEIERASAKMRTAANQAMGEWKKVSSQHYEAGKKLKKESADGSDTEGQLEQMGTGSSKGSSSGNQSNSQKAAVIKTGDIVFAVLDTSVNSDEPGPILATVVSGKLKGAKLIGSFNMPANAEKMTISFKTMSVPGSARSIPISAYAIDPNTARTALSSRTDHHYLLRYGSMFASSFLEGFGDAFQSANTQVTIGGTGGGDNITIANGVGRSALENAVIGLATVGKTWGQQVQKLFNRPITVEVYAGTGMGILFTQDLTSL